MTTRSQLQTAQDGAPPTGPSAVAGDAVIVCENLVKIYKTSDLEVVALQGLDLIVDQGEFIALVGASGSGKSTLLNVLGGLDVPTAGDVRVNGFELLTMSNAERTHYRRNTIGFVWQQTARNLLPYLTAFENVQTPLLVAGVTKKQRHQRAAELLRLVGLDQRSGHRPEQLSGGEQQRVAIAVALANSPQVLLADEPTGELDKAIASEVFALLRRASDEDGVTIVAATHDPLVADHVDRTVAIRDGRVSSEILRRTEVADDGGHHLVSEEFAVLDRVGRLQLPDEYTAALQLERRVRLTMDPDHINVYPDHGGDA